MLSYEQLFKEVNYMQHLTGGKPQRLYAYLLDDKYRLIHVPATEFYKYEFVGYTYAQSFFPVIQFKKPLIHV
jgi:hypothetical protein